MNISTLHKIVFTAPLSALVSLSVCLAQTGPAFSLSRPLTIGGKDLFSAVGDIAVLPNREILVSDGYQYTIRKFSSAGKPLGKFGRRGGGDGSFESVPYFVRSGSGMIVVAEAGSPRLQFFQTDFSFTRSFRAPGPVVDFIITPRGNVFLNTLPPSQSHDEALLLYDRQGKLLSHLLLPDSETSFALRMLVLENDGAGGCLAAYRYMNRIVRYDSAGKITSVFRMPGLPEKVLLNRSRNEEMGLLPEGVMFHDEAVDTDGTIFLLGGDYSLHPEQDVYVVSPDGRLLTTLILPEQSGVLFIDSNNSVYTRGQSRTVVRKYSLMNHASK